MNTAPGWMTCESPIGPLTVVAESKGITNIHFHGHTPRLSEEARQPMPDVADQLAAYFAGEHQTFELALDLRGTPLQRAVWSQLLEIPYGATATYGEVAGRIDGALYDAGLEPYMRPRVVGAAIGRNPISVVVPCHRVIGADGTLTGYFGGLQRKRLLLDLEGARYGSGASKSANANSQLSLT